VKRSSYSFRGSNVRVISNTARPERLYAREHGLRFNPLKLGIRIIAASSPQAKGRVERAHGTHQDRLVKKLRLAGITHYGEANRYLEEHYIAEHNRRYARSAAAEADYHRRRPTVRQLEEVFWLE